MNQPNPSWIARLFSGAELQQAYEETQKQEAARADIVNMRVALEAVKERMNKIE